MSRKTNSLKMSIRTKLTIVFLFTTLIVFAVNLFMFREINKMIVKIDSIYNSNAELTEVQNALSSVRSNMMDYLNTRSSDSMENYYISEQSYRKMIGKLNDKAYDNSSSIMEKNIRNMSEEYLKLTADTIEAKRGRQVAKCNRLYDESEKVYGYVSGYIYSLNNIQFQSNTMQYEKMLSSLQYSETITMVIMVSVGILNILLVIMLTTSIINPLKKLVDSAHKVAEGNLELEFIENQSGDEISVLTTAFNQMVKSLKEYIVRLRESMEKENELKERELMMESHLKDAKLKYLQAYFLFP